LVYVDVIDEIKYIAEKLDPRLTLDERNLLSIALKNKTNVLRNSWRILDALQNTGSAYPKHHTRRATLIRKQREKIEAELESACKDALSLLESCLLPVATAGEELVFYSKM
jgi:14-3-3 protein epsilon